MKTPEEMAEEYAWKHYGYSAINHQLDFLAGYKAAKDEYKVAIDTYNDVAKQILEQAVRTMIPRDQVADADKVMCSTTMEEIKAVDTGELMPITNLPTPAKWTKPAGWISVKDRLPEVNELCIVNTEWRGVVPATYGNESWIFDDGQGWSEKALSYASHWMPLPAPPKEEK